MELLLHVCLGGGGGGETSINLNMEYGSKPVYCGYVQS